MGLRLHRRSIHEGIRYFCDYCDFKATTQGHLKIHRQSKHEGILYSCNNCDYQTKRQDSLKIHQQFKHEGVQYSCNQCDFHVALCTKVHVPSIFTNFENLQTKQ